MKWLCQCAGRRAVSNVGRLPAVAGAVQRVLSGWAPGRRHRGEAGALLATLLWHLAKIWRIAVCCRMLPGLAYCARMLLCSSVKRSDVQVCASKCNTMLQLSSLNPYLHGLLRGACPFIIYIQATNPNLPQRRKDRSWLCCVVFCQTGPRLLCLESAQSGLRCLNDSCTYVS